MIPPAFQVFSGLHKYSDTTDLLWQAADRLIEYRMYQYLKTSEFRPDLDKVIDYIQAAATSNEKNEKVFVLRYLIMASLFTDQLDIRYDIYRLIVKLGYPCPAHGQARFIYQTGSFHFTAGEAWDDIEDHVHCSFCGDEIILSNIANPITNNEITSNSTRNFPPADQLMEVMEGVNL